MSLVQTENGYNEKTTENGYNEKTTENGYSEKITEIFDSLKITENVNTIVNDLETKDSLKKEEAAENAKTIINDSETEDSLKKEKEEEEEEIEYPSDVEFEYSDDSDDCPSDSEWKSFMSSSSHKGWMRNRPKFEDSPYYLPQFADDEIDRSMIADYIYKYVQDGNYVAPVKNMTRCLELGYGSGTWMMELASGNPECEFFGIDLQPNSPEDTYPFNCNFEIGDFLKGIPYPDEYFDFVYAKMTILFVQPEKYDELFKEIFRVLKKGGWVEFLESDQVHHNKGPLQVRFETVWQQVQNANGNFPLMIRTIPKRFREIGFINVKEEHYNISLGDHGGELGKNMMLNWKLWTILTADFIKEKFGYSNKEEYTEFIENICIEMNKFKTYCIITDYHAQKPE